jgi:hypothetical protein
VSFDVNVRRDCDDAAKFGFVSGGTGESVTSTLKLLEHVG